MGVSLHASQCLDGLEEAPTVSVHPGDGESRAAVFVTIGPYRSEVTLWTRDPETLRMIAAVLDDAARQLDEAIAAAVVVGVDARD